MWKGGDLGERGGGGSRTGRGSRDTVSGPLSRVESMRHFREGGEDEPTNSSFYSLPPLPPTVGSLGDVRDGRSEGWTQ